MYFGTAICHHVLYVYYIYTTECGVGYFCQLRMGPCNLAAILGNHGSSVFPYGAKAEAEQTLFYTLVMMLIKQLCWIGMRDLVILSSSLVTLDNVSALDEAEDRACWQALPILNSL